MTVKIAFISIFTVIFLYLLAFFTVRLTFKKIEAPINKPFRLNIQPVFLKKCNFCNIVATCVFSSFKNAFFLNDTGRKFVLEYKHIKLMEASMKKTKAIKEAAIKEDKIEAEGMLYEYKLFVRESDRVASFRIKLYSIKVKLTDRNGYETEAELNDAFSDIGKAVVFYDKLVDNLATPLNLHYILEDEMV